MFLFDWPSLLFLFFFPKSYYKFLCSIVWLFYARISINVVHEWYWFFFGINFVIVSRRQVPACLPSLLPPASCWCHIMQLSMFMRYFNLVFVFALWAHIELFRMCTFLGLRACHPLVDCAWDKTIQLLHWICMYVQFHARNANKCAPIFSSSSPCCAVNFFSVQKHTSLLFYLNNISILSRAHLDRWHLVYCIECSAHSTLCRSLIRASIDKVFK